MKIVNKTWLYFALCFVVSQNIFGQSPFSRGYKETINTYNNEYTRQQMFDILNLWLEEASTAEIEKIQYNHTVYTQNDKQNYAWSISRGTSGYNNSGELFHWICFSVSNGEFYLYYPAKGTSLSNFPSFPAWPNNSNSGQIARNINYWESQARYILNDFIDKSKRNLAIYNDNYGEISLNQLTQWAESVIKYVGFTLMMKDAFS